MGTFTVDGKEQGLDGDKTTTGATCYSSLPQARGPDNRGVLRLGDKTSPCGVCGQPGEIIEGLGFMEWQGIPTAVDGAVVLCDCPPGDNRLIAPSRTAPAARTFNPAQPAPATIKPNIRPPDPHLMRSVLDAYASHEQKTNDRTFARRFIVSDSENGQPLINRRFTATVDGQQITGMTDSNGIAHVDAPSADSTISIHITFRSPARELPELAGMTTRTVTTTTRVEELLHGQTPKPVAISIDDRAATREAIIRKVRELGFEFVERSEWWARSPKIPLVRDWDYTMIAMHHAGRSYFCANGHLQTLFTQISQQGLLKGGSSDDIGYHFAIDCSGVVYEGRDIRFKGEHLLLYNSNVIGIVLLNDFTTPEEGSDVVAQARTELDKIGISTTKQVPALQADATINLITALKGIFHIERFGGHREFPHQSGADGKICPGNVGMELVEYIRTETRLHKPLTS